MRRFPLALNTGLVAVATSLLLLIAGPPTHAAPVNPAGDGLAAPKSLSAPDRERMTAKAPKTQAEFRELNMSAGGARTAGLLHNVDLEGASAFAPLGGPAGGPLASGAFSPLTIGSTDIIVHGAGDFGFQSETSIAANADGSVLIAGYNEARGGANGLGVSRSIDGGATWAEVPVGPGGLGSLPTAPAGSSFFSDPDVKFDPVNNRFIYAGIYVRPAGAGGLQGIAISISDATGGTWSNPIEATPTFIASSAADKEFMDVNPVTGRILITWTDFGATVTIKRTYSDDGGVSWAPAVVVGNPGLGGLQSSIPRFRPGTSNLDSKAYVAWRQLNGDGTRNTAFSRSLDGGTTWSVQTTTTLDFNPEDYIIGNDRVNTSPSMAVDYTSGTIYLVYQVNNGVGEGDIAFQRSVDDGASFSPRILIDSNPGSDRAQWYPWVTVDQSTGRVHVIWYDQDPQAQGDVTEAMHAYSTDGGLTWSRPTPVLDRPFRAGYGNDLGQPNLGDYIGATGQGGKLHSLVASTGKFSLFSESATVSGSLFSDDSYYDQLLESAQVASVRLGTVTFAELCPNVNGNLDSRETASFTFPLENYVANPNASPVTYTNVSATLSTTTPGVTIMSATQPYADIAPLSTQSNGVGYLVSLSSSFVPGTYVDLLLTVTTDQGTTQLPYLLTTGTPISSSTLFSDNFEGSTVGATPTGWSFINSGSPFTGTNAGPATPAWTTATTIPGGGVGSKMAFHSNSTGTKWHRLVSAVSPAVPTPAPGTTNYVQLDFDIAYSTEDEPSLQNLAYDGVTLRITDQTGAPNLARSILAEAVGEIIQTGSNTGFPKMFPRSSTSAPYFQDVACWAGFSNGFKHVTMKFNGQGMVGRKLQIRWEYTEDGSGICTSVLHPTPCGVGIDNVVLSNIVVGLPPGPPVSLDASPPKSQCGEDVTLTATVPASATGTIEFFDGAASLGAPVAVVGGSASFLWSSPSVGSHTVVAKYSGDGCYQASQSSPVLHEVNPLQTQTTLDAQPAKTTCGDKVDLTATVIFPVRPAAHGTLAVAPGSVTFLSDGNPIGTSPVSGHTATLSVTTLPPGVHSLTAAYSGDDCYGPSASSPVSHEVNAIPTTTTASSDVNPAQCNQKVTLQATVTPAVSVGTVTFFDAGNPLGLPVPVSNGVATLSVTFQAAPPIHPITATYSGGDCYGGSTSPPYDQRVDPIPTTTDVTADLNPAKEGTKVNLTATVSPSAATGVVTFFDGASFLGQSNVSGGQATLSVTFTGTGGHPITATYNGDGCYQPSTSAPYIENIVPDNPPQVTVISPNGGENLIVGDDVKLSWSATDDNQVVSVTLSISRDNGATYEQIAVDIPNTGTYTWTVTPPGTNTDGAPVYSALFKVEAKDNADQIGDDTSDAPFSIYDAAVPVVITRLDAIPLDAGIAVKWGLANRSVFTTVQVERSDAEVGPYLALAADIHEEGELTVAVDRTVEPARTYWYRLVATTNAGSRAVFGPVSGSAAAPREFALRAVWPNPTRAGFTTHFAVATSAMIRLSVADLQGREVVALAKGQYAPGLYQVAWDGRTDRGGLVTPGMYFVRLQARGKTLVTRFAITR